MAKVIVKILVLTYLLVQSFSFITAMDNDKNKNNDLLSRIKAQILKLEEQQLIKRQSIISQIQNEPHIKEENNNQEINDQHNKKLIIDLTHNHDNDDQDNDKDNISDHDEEPDQELQTDKLSDFDYVQDLTQEDFIEYCNQEIFSKDLLWIGRLNKNEFEKLQSTKQLQEILLQRKTGTDTSENNKHSVIDISSNNNNNNDNEKDEILDLEKPHQELQTYTISDFDYVQELTQKDFIEYCHQGIFNKDLLWIGELDKKEFKELQSTKQLLAMLLESTTGRDTSENTKHSVIDISSNNDNSKNNENNNNNEYNIHENETETETETETRECTICLDELSTSEFITLDCNHNQFCKKCLVDTIKPGLQEKNSKLWKCPANSCTHHMTKRDREKILAGEKIHITELSTLPSDEEYTKEEIKDLVKHGAFAQDKPILKECEELLEREELLTNTKIKFCPIDYCKGHFKVYSYENRVTCDLCKNEYCNQCLKDHDTNTSCEEHERFLNMGNEEKIQESEKWLQANTKPCPSCRYGIEKSGGCQHMTCKQCTHQFCWVCLGDWNNGNGPCASFQCGRQLK